MGGWVRVGELRRLKVIEDNLRRWKNIQNVVGSEHHLSRGKQLTSGECILHLSLSRSVLSGRICQLGPTGAPNSQYKKTIPNLDSRVAIPFLPYVRDIWQNYSNCYISNFCWDFWTLQFEKYNDLRTADIGSSTSDAEPVHPGLYAMREWKRTSTWVTRCDRNLRCRLHWKTKNRGDTDKLPALEFL